MKHCPLHHVPYVPAKFEIAMANGVGDAFTRTYIIWPWPWGQGHTKCCPVPSTSCNLCTNKVWCCYIPLLMGRCIYKKLHYLTLTPRSRSHEILPSALYIMWPMRLQSLKLLRQQVLEEMHLQENSLIDLDLGQGHTKCCPVPSTSCDLYSYKVWSCYVKQIKRRYIYKKIQYLTCGIDLGVKVTLMLPSTLDIMWPVQLQSLKLLRLTV